MSRLVVTHGPHFGSAWTLLDPTTLGRASTCTIQLLDEKASRVHSVLWREGDGWMVRDEGSSNGTGHNGTLLMAPQALKPGDEIAIGETLMLFDPDLQILRDIEGAGAVVVAPASHHSAPPGTPAAAPRGDLRVVTLLTELADVAGGPRGVGRPAALLEAAARGLKADKAAFLTAPTSEQPMMTVATWPHRSRVAVGQRLLDELLGQRVTRRAETLFDLSVRGGRTLVTNRPGATLGVPVARGGRLRGVLIFLADDSSAFSGYDEEAVHAALTVAFAPLLSGDPALLRPARPAEPVAPPVADSRPMQALLPRMEAAAEERGAVVLRSEPGAGRGYLAGWMHRIGPRADGPFVIARCGGLPPATIELTLFGHEPGAVPGIDGLQRGAIERADGGTLFLDDIDALDEEEQTRLLRVLQDGRLFRVGGTKPVPIDVRFVVGTRHDLQRLAADGAFRDDLRQWLATRSFVLPPLRERLADIEPLLRRFTDRYNRRTGSQLHGFSPEAIGLLETHDWPENVHELHEMADRLLATTGSTWVQVEEVEDELSATPDATFDERAGRLTTLELRRLRAALDQADGDWRRAAHLLRLPATHLERFAAILELEQG